MHVCLLRSFRFAGPVGSLSFCQQAGALHVASSSGAASASCSCFDVARVWLVSSLNLLPDYLGVEWYYANIILSGN